MGITSADFQQEGKVEVVSDKLKSLQRMGESSGEHVFSTRGEIPSGPVALEVSSEQRARFTWRVRILMIGRGVQSKRDGFAGFLP